MTTSCSWRRRGLRAGALTAALAGAAVVVCGPALAHVRVDPSTATQGGYATVTFRVPTESDTASTVALTIDLPTDTPLASVRLRPLPGWTGSVSTAALPAPVDVGDLRLSEAPRAVTWTAQAGQGVTPGQFQEFSISIGPLPATEHLALPATQTYSDGEVVHWDQPATPGGAEPERPAPELTLTPAVDGAGSAGTTAGASAGTATVAATAGPGARQTAVTASRSDPTARVLGAGGLAVGVLGVGAGVLGRRRDRA